MSKTIMVVEDEQSFHNLYEEILEDSDYEIIQTFDGDDALAKLEEKKPDLIILDIVLEMLALIFIWQNVPAVVTQPAQAPQRNMLVKKIIRRENLKENWRL